MLGSVRAQVALISEKLRRSYETFRDCGDMPSPFGPVVIFQHWAHLRRCACGIPLTQLTMQNRHRLDQSEPQEDGA